MLAGPATIGSYTTFSTWMLETHRLGEDGQLLRGSPQRARERASWDSGQPRSADRSAGHCERSQILQADDVLWSMSEEALKLTTYFGERSRVRGTAAGR